ncbi:MAG: isochorismatase family protein [Clostridium sp.]
MGKVLVVIGVQNEYFDGGKLPLWNRYEVLTNVIRAIYIAKESGFNVINVKHVSSVDGGLFDSSTQGVYIHPNIASLSRDYSLVFKSTADAFYGTNLDSLLTSLNATEIYLCGMMSHSCITFTALSKSAEKYRVRVLGDCCTSVSEVINNIALSELSMRTEVVTLDMFK